MLTHHVVPREIGIDCGRIPLERVLYEKKHGVQKKYYSVAMNKSRRSILDGFLIDFDGLWMDFA